jgi:hypothetical protein
MHSLDGIDINLSILFRLQWDPLCETTIRCKSATLDCFLGNGQPRQWNWWLLYVHISPFMMILSRLGCAPYFGAARRLGSRSVFGIFHVVCVTEQFRGVMELCGVMSSSDIYSAELHGCSAQSMAFESE